MEKVHAGDDQSKLVLKKLLWGPDWGARARPLSLGGPLGGAVAVAKKGKSVSRSISPVAIRVPLSGDGAEGGGNIPVFVTVPGPGGGQ